MKARSKWDLCWAKQSCHLVLSLLSLALELCGAVLAVEMAEHILDELDHKPNAVKFYCDSKVVLGYIYNQSRCFFVYVHNRVQRIRQSTSPDQWSYVPTVQNPADLATRSVLASQLTTPYGSQDPASSTSRPKSNRVSPSKWLLLTQTQKSDLV